MKDAAGAVVRYEIKISLYKYDHFSCDVADAAMVSVCRGCGGC